MISINYGAYFRFARQPECSQDRAGGTLASASVALPSRGIWGQSSLVKSDAMDQVLKTRVVADGIKDGVHL
jgi:hypothetical protein